MIAIPIVREKDRTAIHTAFMKAANHLEREPYSFDFTTTLYPPRVERFSGQACAYGWVMHFLDETRVDRMVYGMVEYRAFEAAMMRLRKWYEIPFWLSRRAAARDLRRFADKYYRVSNVIPFTPKAA